MITITLNFEKLNLLTTLLGGLSFNLIFITDNLQVKANISILEELQKKLLKKLIDCKKDKDFKIKLKYYQAFCLYYYLVLIDEDRPYEKNVILQLKNETHKQL